MPTSGDLKSGDSLFFTTLPPSPKKFNEPLSPSPHPWQIWEWLRTLYDVLHEVHTIKTRNHRFDARNNLCQWVNRCKNVPETILRIRKIQFWAINRLNLRKLTHRTAQKMILSRRSGGPDRRPGICVVSGRVGMYVPVYQTYHIIHTGTMIQCNL